MKKYLSGKSLLALALAVLMLTALLPVGALATTGESGANLTTTGGSGTDTTGEPGSNLTTTGGSGTDTTGQPGTDPTTTGGSGTDTTGQPGTGTHTTTESTTETDPLDVDDAEPAEGTDYSAVTVSIRWPALPSGVSGRVSIALTYTPNDGSPAQTLHKNATSPTASRRFSIPLAAGAYSVTSVQAGTNSSGFSVSADTDARTVNVSYSAPAEQAPSNAPQTPPAGSRATSGSRTVDVQWENVPDGVTVSVLLEYVNGDDAGSQTQTAVSPASSCTFGNIPFTAEDGTEYRYTLTANAAAGYAADPVNTAVVVRPITTVNRDPDGNALDTRSLEVAIVWQNVPDGAYAGGITLIATNELGDEYTQSIDAGTLRQAITDLPCADGDGNPLSYTLSVDTSGTDFSATVNGATVTLTYSVDDAEADERLNGVLEELNALPSLEEAQAMDLAGGDFAQLRSNVAYVADLYAGLLTDAQRAALAEQAPAAVENYRALKAYLAEHPAEEGSAGPVFFMIGPSTTTISGNVSFVLGSTGATPPATVRVVLQRNGVDVQWKDLSTAALPVSYSFPNLLDCDGSGNPYAYNVYGTAIAGFTSGSTGNNVVYTAVAGPSPSTVNISVEVHWTDEPTTGYTRPTFNVWMYKRTASGAESTVGSVWNPTDTVNSHTFQTTTAAAGESYYVRQAALAAYETTYSESGGSVVITNRYVGNLVAATGSIRWVDAPLSKPGFTITLRGASGYTDSLTVPGSQADSDNYAFPQLPAGDTYSVSVAAPAGYDVSVSGSGLNYNIVLTCKDPYFHLHFTVRWVDNNNKRARRPIETTAYLYYKGVPTGEQVQVKASENWTAVFYNLSLPYQKYYSVRVAKEHYYHTYYARTAIDWVKVTNVYGRYTSSDDPVEKAPKVGDPLLDTPLARRQYAVAAEQARALSALARDVNATGTPAETIDFGTLKKLNRDVVGWLTLAGTPIDYPIVKGGNNTTYLTRLFSGESNSAGALFMDYKNDGTFANRCTTVYGHNMNDGSMFAALLNYQKQSYYDAHPSLELQTPKGRYLLEPIAGFFTDEAYSNVVKRSFSGSNAFLAYVDKCIRASNFQSKASVIASDQLVTFVTCSSNYGDGTRYLLVCKLSKAD